MVNFLYKTTHNKITFDKFATDVETPFDNKEIIQFLLDKKEKAF